MTEAQVMSLLPEIGFALVTLLFILCIAVDIRIKATQRCSDLSNAVELLNEHYAALEKFMDDAAAPQVLKDVLLQFSDGTAIKEVAISVARDFAMGRPKSESKDDNTSVAALEALHSHRPDLERLFVQSVGTGLLAMYYRWPETSKYRDLMVKRIASGRTSEVSFATRAAMKTRHTHRNGDSNIGGDLAIA